MHKKSISTGKVDIKRIILSKKDSYGNKGAFKYFLRYIHMLNMLIC